MARTSEEEQRRLRRKRLVRGLAMGGAAIGVPALANAVVSRRARALPDATWGSGDRYTWDHGEIVYQRLGEGPPLLLLHSFGPGHSSAEWRSAAEELAASFEVFVPDLPGWGQSGEVEGPYDGEHYLQLLRDFAKDVVGQRLTVVAAGLPAAYAVQWAVDAPEVVVALALVVPLGIEMNSDEPDIKDAIMHRLLTLPILGTSAINVFTNRSGIANYLRREVYATATQVDDALVDLHYLNSHRRGNHAALAAYLSGYLNLSVRGALGRLKQPLWIAWGRQAASPSVESADLWLQRKPDTDLEVFEQTGVLPHAESPGEFSRKLESFLQHQVLDGPGVSEADDPS